MRKRILLLSCLALLAAAGRTQAQSVNINDIEYTVNDDGQTASVTGYTGEPVDVALPATVDIEGTDYAVTRIAYRAFSGCTTLQNVTLPEGLQSINQWAFENCSSLQSITFPEGLQTIGYEAFFDCLVLQSVALPSTLQNIKEGAFDCCLLEDITSLATIPPAIYEDSFDTDTYITATLHVPSDAVDDYQAAEYWKNFQHIVGDLPPVPIEDVASDASPVRYADGVITTSDAAAITVYAQSGAVVRHAEDATSLSLEGLLRGIYIICIEMDGQQQTMKAVL